MSQKLLIISLAGTKHISRYTQFFLIWIDPLPHFLTIYPHISTAGHMAETLQMSGSGMGILQQWRRVIHGETTCHTTLSSSLGIFSAKFFSERNAFFLMPREEEKANHEMA